MVRAIDEHAHSPAVTKELDYWSSVGDKSGGPLPAIPGRREHFGSVEDLSDSLTADETRALIYRCGGIGSQLDELLLTATTQAFSRWTGQTTVLLDLEGHGREEFVDGIDASRTLGWFTTIYPVALELEPRTAAHDATRRFESSFELCRTTE